jgi:hypothetical protein
MKGAGTTIYTEGFHLVQYCADAEECDARDDDSSTTAGTINKKTSIERMTEVE